VSFLSVKIFTISYLPKFMLLPNYLLSMSLPFLFLLLSCIWKHLWYFFSP
jgi:hypothetical protein